jgi:hypothetical protein
VIACAFEGEDDVAAGSGLDIVEGQSEGAGNGPTDLKSPGLLCAEAPSALTQS